MHQQRGRRDILGRGRNFRGERSRLPLFSFAPGRPLREAAAQGEDVRDELACLWEEAMRADAGWPLVVGANRQAKVEVELVHELAQVRDADVDVPFHAVADVSTE